MNRFFGQADGFGLTICITIMPVDGLPGIELIIDEVHRRVDLVLQRSCY